MGITSIIDIRSSLFKAFGMLAAAGRISSVLDAPARPFFFGRDCGVYTVGSKSKSWQ